MGRRTVVLFTLVATIGCNGCSSDSSVDAPSQPGNGGANGNPNGNPVVSVDATVHYQTMDGWEATAEAGQTEISSFPAYQAKVTDMAVNYLGLNRLRLEVKSGAENPEDNFADFQAGRISSSDWHCLRYATVNDNADPYSINPAGFHFTEMDIAVERVVLPIKQRLEANGEKLYLNVNYVAFATDCPGEPYDHYNNPQEYAEFVLATYQHLKSKYGLVPDSWEVILEPDNTDGLWNAAQVTAAIAAAGDRLKAAGFTPHFVASSNVDMTTAVSYINNIMAAPAARQYMGELSYHRYRGVSTSSLQAIANIGKQYGVNTAMLEHIGSGYEDLYADLVTGRNSAWQQFTLAYTGSDDGGSYFKIGDGANPTVTPGSRTRYLRQYFRHVRLGAVRVAATSADDAIAPVAFVNTNGKYVVVVKTDGAASFYVTGVPAATYGISYTTASADGEELPAVSVKSGQGIDVTMPGKGVLTVYQH